MSSAASWLKQMTPVAQTTACILALGISFFWLKTPGLRPFYLQGLAAAALVYFLLKWLHRRRFWHLVPHTLSGELAIITFAVTLLIGATGNLKSPLFPLTYVHLFLLVFAAEIPTSIVLVFCLILFHYLLGFELNATHLTDLISMPFILVMFLFAKHQYQTALQEKASAAQAREDITQTEQDIWSFLENTLKPSLQQLQTQLTQTNPTATPTLTQLEENIAQLETHLQKYQASNEQPPTL